MGGFVLLSGTAIGSTLYVNGDGLCGGNSPCYTHPQDAVNAANTGDSIKVYPGIYGHRQFTSPVPPHWGPGDQYAPALIVFKDDLTIEAVDPDPTKTIIQTTYNFWVNKSLPGGGGGGSIEHSTGCSWNYTTKAWDDAPATPGDCVRPTFGTAPNGIAIIANNVTIDGITAISTYPGDNPAGYPNTSGIFIGALYAGDPNANGITGTVIKNCVAKGHSGIRLWKAPDTVISACVISNDTITIGIVQPALEVWDGWCDNPLYPSGGGWCEGPNVGSSGLQILNNNITSYLGAAGFSLGGYYDGQVDHSNLYIDGNTIISNGHGVTFWGSGGTNKVMTCNNTVTVPDGYSKVGVWWGTYDGPFDWDSDNDGIKDCNEPEFCRGTVPDIPEIELGTNRWIWDGEEWITNLPKGKGPQKSFTIQDTLGCSCFQILATFGNPMKGHYKFGCSSSVIEEFIAYH
jgi:hypothetical protein